MGLVVTFTQVFSGGTLGAAAPIPVGGAARTETLDIQSATQGSTRTELAAAGAENVAVLRATEDCWVKFGGDELTVEAGAGHFLPADTFREFGVSEGDQVAVIAA